MKRRIAAGLHPHEAMRSIVPNYSETTPHRDISAMSVMSGIPETAAIEETAGTIQ